MAKRQIAAPEPVTRTRRSEEERIADLEAQIARLHARAAAKKVKRDPTLKHIGAALRSIDKALASSQDAATRQALDEARATMSACLSLNGVSRGRKRRPGPASASDGVSASRRQALLAHVQAHPGHRGEEITAALGTDARSVRPVMLRLIDEKKVKTKGQRRGMQYFGV